MKSTANRSNGIANNIASSIANISSQTSASQKRTSGLLSLAAVLLCGLTASAQNSKVVAEQGFTIAPDVQNSIVLKAQANAACDMHATGTSDTRSMRFYANGDGYVKIHASAREGIEGRLQLDCSSSNGNIVSYPLHLVASSSPTSDMPAPQSKVPAPKGSKVRPGLSEAQAQSMTDAQLDKLGYPARPDVLSSPDQYTKWLERVSKPMTMMPVHLVSTNVTATPGSYTSNNWSGLEAHSKTQHQYSAVTATWNVPVALASTDGNPDYSAFWIGLDGDGTNDLVQAGTEQDAMDFLGIVLTDYYAWSELLPNQPTENTVSGVDPGDEMEVEVWIGTGSGSPNPNGNRGSFRITDATQSQEWRFDTMLNGTKYNGTEAEWIMERPTIVGSGLPELTAYLIATMVDADVLNAKTTKWVKCGTAANRNISMWNGKDELSEAQWLGKGTNQILFFWLNFK